MIYVCPRQGRRRPKRHDRHLDDGHYQSIMESLDAVIGYLKRGCVVVAECGWMMSLMQDMFVLLRSECLEV